MIGETVPVSITPEQKAVCARFHAEPHVADPNSKVGMGGSDEGVIHGLRQPPEGDTTGWYIWRGEYSESGDFFEPLHTWHLADRLPEVLPYLALPPGWRFLLAPDCEDVWYDDSLLKVESPK